MSDNEKNQYSSESEGEDHPLMNQQHETEEKDNEQQPRNQTQQQQQQPQGNQLPQQLQQQQQQGNQQVAPMYPYPVDQRLTGNVGGRTGAIRESRIKDRPQPKETRDSSLKIKVELDLEVEVDLYARVKGDVTVGLM